MQPRDYGPFPYSPIIDRPAWNWPNGARLAVWVIPNIEIFPLDRLVPRENPIVPNVIGWAARDYGNRVAVFRMMDVLHDRGIRATVALNSLVCEKHPRIIQRARELEWELMGHGETNSIGLPAVPPDEEQSVIMRTMDTIEKASGVRPKGWLGPGLAETWNTLEYLSAAGCRYVADWVNDDQPYTMDVGNPPLVSLPYSTQINDATVIALNNQTVEDFAAMIRRQFDTLYAEGKKSARVMAIALHPWMTGVPHAIGPLSRSLDFIRGHDSVWFATGSEILDAYLSAAPKLR